MKKEMVARLNTISRVGMNVFISKDLFDKVKIRKKWFTFMLENSESIIITLEWTEDGLKNIQYFLIKNNSGPRIIKKTREIKSRGLFLHPRGTLKILEVFLALAINKYIKYFFVDKLTQR